jgi:phospholipid transport system substrate-binding protein
MRLFLGTVMMIGAFAGSTLAYAELTPTETVKSAVTAVMTILSDPLYQQPAMADARRGAIENVVRSNVSYTEMARRSLGVAWMVLSEPERHRFSTLFVQVLRDAVACRMDEYSQAQIYYLAERREGNFAEVHTLFRGDKMDTVIDVRLVNRSGQWLMYDAIIDDVHLVENYRAQFLYVMRDGTYTDLIGKLEARALLQKTFERTSQGHNASLRVNSASPEQPN